MSLAALAQKVEGTLLGPEVEFGRLSTDTRTLRQGDAYLALRGSRFDGNDFVSAAADAGACAAIVSRRAETVLPQLVVSDTHQALGCIAAENRRRSQAKVIALTGSQGKTTVKEMLGCILGARAATLITKANLNNTIGVPLTLLGLSSGHRYAVIEMGANAAGEIAFSTAVCMPDIALITNASAAHVEGFGSLTGIVRAKGEILDELSDNGVAVLNADDGHVQDWMDRASGRQLVLFSLENRHGKAGFYTRNLTSNDSGQVSFSLVAPGGEVAVDLQLLGRHNALNAVAAAAAADAAGARLADIASSLSRLQPVKGRLCPLRGINGCRLIDDSYNASPGSFRAAIDVLLSLPGDHVLVAGEMKELGVESAALHREVGRYAREAGVTELWAAGEVCRHMVTAFGDRGRHFTGQQELIEHCHHVAHEGLVFMIKGSRGARMDNVVDALKATGGA